MSPNHVITRLENCEFICHEDDYITIITAKEPSGEWKAIVLRSNSSSGRDALLSSEPSESEEKAFASLHAKSAEAAAVYIKTNGFSFLRDPKRDDDDMSDGGASTSSSGSSSASSVVLLDSSDDELMTPAASSSKSGRVVSSKPSSKKKKQKGKAKVFESETSSDEGEVGVRPGHAHVIRHNPVVRHPPPPRWAGPAPPPPHGWVGPPPPPPRMPGMNSGVSGQQPRPPHTGPPLPGVRPGVRPGMVRPMGIPVASQRVYDVRITIKWIHHSEQWIFESTRASIRALQDTTLSYIRTHMNAFSNTTPLDHSPNKVWTLQANVKQAFFGSETYDMSGYRGDDLTKLFNIVGKNDIPRFEIEVDYVRPVGSDPRVIDSGAPAGGPVMVD